ncbi:MAG: spore maturation protein [Deltaproteobacteria bacterium]|nr:spore maturation protein [Deltaproteobacteria bacterium]
MSKTGFEIALGLTGVLTFWLGIMKIGEAGGMVALLTRLTSPVFRRLFPDVPPDHPAVGAMMLNLSANMLGLDNAATPLGLKAMQELQTLNPDKETASNAQIMFLVINTSAVTIIPITIITYLYQLGYQNPTEVFIPILIATFCSTLAGVSATCLMQRISLMRSGILIILGGAAAIVALLVAALLQLEKEQLRTWSLVGSNCFIFCIIILFISLAACRRVNVYEEFIAGAKEGFQVAITIIPYLIAMLVAIGIFRASGAMDVLLTFFTGAAQGTLYLADLAGLGTCSNTPPAFIDALPTALMKPLSGSGARGLMIETIKTNGVDALVSKMVAVIQGSTETTFYVLAVYFGSVGIRKTRHAVLCGLIADGTGIIAAISICYLFF